MGQKSRGKWLRRLELARMGGTQDKATELRKWHASWLLPCAVTILVTWIAAGSGIEMIPLIVVVWLGFAVSALAVWLLTNIANHRSAKVTLTIFLGVVASLATIWAFEEDRPIINPEIGGIITQNYKQKWLALDIEANIQNSGEQSSYAKTWGLALTIDGKIFRGRQLPGEEIPEGAIKLAELRDQEFPKGKPVSGWLVFAFADLPHEKFEPYSSCASAIAEKVSITLTVTDSKEGKEFSQTRNLKDLLTESCQSLKTTQQ